VTVASITLNRAGKSYRHVVDDTQQGVQRPVVDAAKALDDAHRIPVDVIVKLDNRNPAGFALRKYSQ